MIAVDTNILIYAHRRDSPHHDLAARSLVQLAESRAAWAIPWPCLHEFFAVVTRPRVYRPPSTTDEALDQIDAWREAPGLVLLSETGSHWSELRSIIEDGRITGPLVHDARIAAICREHGVRELWSADKDFSRISGLRTRNPLLI